MQHPARRHSVIASEAKQSSPAFAKGAPSATAGLWIDSLRSQ
jgi:hypothetical protein